MSEIVAYPTSQLVKRLKTVTILGALSERQLTALAKVAKVVAFAKGETVVNRGEKGDGLYLILEGSAEVRRGGRILAKLGAGQFFGEMSLFDDQPRSADVVALRPSKLVALSKWEFWGFAAGEPEVVLRLLEEMSLRLRAADKALAD
ncbi:MAG: cyclic nucleotide-binding domain-containing protein [Thermoplasmata archaeon]